MKNLKKFGLAALLVCTSSAYSFSETNIQYMRGSNFKVNSTDQTKNRSVTTFEHVSGWSYGDNYLFFDVTNIDKKGTEIYGEWHPRLSLSKMTGKEMGYGPVRDYFLATQVNMNGGETPARAYLYGVGLDWNISGFNYVVSNLYIRKEPNKAGTGVQLTMAWAYPIEVMDSKWKLEGFFDWNMKSYNNGNNAKNFLIEPQLLYDLGNSIGLGDSRLYLGVEYTYWKNKFGIKSTGAFPTTEKNLKYMVKFYL